MIMNAECECADNHIRPFNSSRDTLPQRADLQLHDRERFIVWVDYRSFAIMEKHLSNELTFMIVAGSGHMRAISGHDHESWGRSRVAWAVAAAVRARRASVVRPE